MKMKELMDLIARAMKDSSPRMSFYADALREHMSKKHRDMYDEDVTLL